MIYFSSDFHLSHSRIINYCHRPFKDAKEMDDAIIDNFLKVLQKGDTLYILGDISFSGFSAENFLSKFIGVQLHFIVGNHDRAITPDICKKYFVSTSKLKDIKVEGQKITLCHYAMLSWNGSCHNTWSAHGHSHTSIVSEKFKGKRMNVGVDLNNYKPVSFEQMKEYMKKQTDNWDYVK